MPGFGRRRFIVHGSMGAAGLGATLSHLWSRRAGARGYGDLVPDPRGVIDLPCGFSYSIIESSGDPMDDGYIVPGLPDGMACFESDDGLWVLMRNHEVSYGNSAQGAYPDRNAPKVTYNPDGYGGVTRVLVDPVTRTRVSSNLVLTGTVRNCGGGPSPWGWLSCEEYVGGDHGYVFLCSTRASSVRTPRRLSMYGRFNHEAAAVDPVTAACYLTEDRGNGCLYRFMPDDPREPFVGQLAALRVVGAPALNTASDLRPGDIFDCDWVDLVNPMPVGDTLRFAAQQVGAAIFTRGEGIWHADGQLYISCTNGGPVGRGQIFRLVDGADGASLQLVAQSSGADHLDFPDNITVAPWGQVFIAEDGTGEQFLRTLDPDGTMAPFARNAISSSEFTGVCFSPDGQALFVNIQHNGLTLMVTGPFLGDPPERGCEPVGGSSSGGSEGGSDETYGDASSSGDDATSATAGGDGSSSDSSGPPVVQALDDDGGCNCSATHDASTGGLVATVAALALTRGRAPGRRERTDLPTVAPTRSREAQTTSSDDDGEHA